MKNDKIELSKKKIKAKQIVVNKQWKATEKQRKENARKLGSDFRYTRIKPTRRSDFSEFRKRVYSK